MQKTGWFGKKCTLNFTDKIKVCTLTEYYQKNIYLKLEQRVPGAIIQGAAPAPDTPKSFINFINFV